MGLQRIVRGHENHTTAVTAEERTKGKILIWIKCRKTGKSRNEPNTKLDTPFCLLPPHKAKGISHFLRTLNECPEHEKKDLMQWLYDEKMALGPARSNFLKKTNVRNHRRGKELPLNQRKNPWSAWLKCTANKTRLSKWILAAYHFSLLFYMSFVTYPIRLVCLNGCFSLVHISAIFEVWVVVM